MVTASFPSAPNPGQYLLTRSSYVAKPRSTIIAKQIPVMGLVPDHSGARVSRVQGCVRALSFQPPQRSTTNSPPRVTATEAPSSSWSVKLRVKTFFTCSNSGRLEPSISAFISVFPLWRLASIHSADTLSCASRLVYRSHRVDKFHLG